MATFVKFRPFVEAAMEKKHDLSADTFKLFFCAAANAPSVDNSVLANLTTASAANLDSITLTITSSSQTSGTYKWVVADKVCTASGAVGPFRYIGIYNDTATNDELVGYWDHGSEITMASTDTYSINFDDTNGVFQIG